MTGGAVDNVEVRVLRLQGPQLLLLDRAECAVSYRRARPRPLLPVPALDLACLLFAPYALEHLLGIIGN